jgi:hypothetical protein
MVTALPRPRLIAVDSRRREQTHRHTDQFNTRMNPCHMTGSLVNEVIVRQRAVATERYCAYHLSFDGPFRSNVLAP